MGTQKSTHHKCTNECCHKRTKPLELIPVPKNLKQKPRQGYIKFVFLCFCFYLVKRRRISFQENIMYLPNLFYLLIFTFPLAFSQGANIVFLLYPIVYTFWQKIPAQLHSKKAELLLTLEVLEFKILSNIRFKSCHLGLELLIISRGIESTLKQLVRRSLISG